MPTNEVEKHPFLQLQEHSKGFSFDSIEKMIVGTFPIYCITSSETSELKGQHLREKWADKAYFKFFYGSRENDFWKILSTTFKLPFPKTVDDAINLLNENGIFISDVLKSVVRNNYSPLDSDLGIKEINIELIKKVDLFPNLKTIIFTSKIAKAAFCEMAGIVSSGSIQEVQINSNNIMLYSLPTPSGNGRSVRHYFNDFPPNKEELANKNTMLPYAINYRMRIYNEILK